MLRSLKSLRDYVIRTVDGDIGNVYGFLFDDQSWIIRYLVVETGNWLMGRKVLLSTTALGKPLWEEKAFPVMLSKEQVEESPDIATEKPVSRQMEEDLHRYYNWSPYWRPAMPAAGVGAAAAAETLVEEEREEEEEIEIGKTVSDPHLRSTREVTGYHIQAIDDEIGHVEDFIADDENWIIRYLVVDTRNWLPGKSVIVSPTWVQEVNWIERQVHVDLHRQTIEASPEFDPSKPINREYEVRLYDYYGRPRYWKRF